MTQSEHKFCEFQLSLTGSFFTYLIKAMLVADSNNMALLKAAYPDLCEVVYKFQNEGGYWQKLNKEWNETMLIQID